MMLWAQGEPPIGMASPHVHFGGIADVAHRLGLGRRHRIDERHRRLWRPADPWTCLRAKIVGPPRAGSARHQVKWEPRRAAGPAVGRHSRPPLHAR